MLPYLKNCWTPAKMTETWQLEWFIQKSRSWTNEFLIICWSIHFKEGVRLSEFALTNTHSSKSPYLDQIFGAFRVKIWFLDKNRTFNIVWQNAKIFSKASLKMAESTTATQTSKWKFAIKTTKPPYQGTKKEWDWGGGGGSFFFQLFYCAYVVAFVDDTPSWLFWLVLRQPQYFPLAKIIPLGVLPRIWYGGRTLRSSWALQQGY